MIEARRRFLLGVGSGMVGGGLVACTATGPGPQTGDNSADKYAFGAYSRLDVVDLGSTGTSVTLSPDKRIASILFDKAVVELVTSDATTNKAAMLAGQIDTHLSDDEGMTGYLVSVRGTVEKSAYSAASLTLEFAGTVRCLEWRYGEPKSETFEFPEFAILRRPVRRQNPNVPPLPPFFLAAALTAQRDGPGEHVGLYLDSIDVESVV